MFIIKFRNFNQFIGVDFPFKLTALFLLICGSLLHAESAISILDAKQILGTKLVEVTYSLTDPGFGTVKVALQASSDGGTTWTVPVISVSGDVGTVPLISAVTPKKIVWNAGNDWPQSYTSQMLFRIIAEDGFSLIAAGNFTMGPWIPGSPISIGGGLNSSGSLYSGNLYHEWAVVPQSFTAMVSSFYLQEKETTKAQWDEVRSWGMDNGYTDLPTGGGKAANHPVHSVGWSDVVKWCNARSEKEGLTPVYTVSGAVMRTGGAHPVANWTANGYRLPTEAEWEKAAGGGVADKRFPWGTDTISHEQANYYGYSGGDFRDPVTEYDLSPINNYHPNYNDGVLPYTSPIGSFQANKYGLYDMAGNVREWCWDWFSFQYDTTTTIDPRGPASQHPNFNGFKVTRGGSWFDKARRVRVADRNAYTSDFDKMGCGFRPARTSISGPRVAELPTVTTPTATSIAKTDVIMGGNVISDGGSTIKERGVVYSATATNNNPVIKGTGVTKVTAVGTTGVFTVPITGLTRGTGYSYKAYAINSLGIPSYTNVATFRTEFDFVLIPSGTYPRGGTIGYNPGSMSVTVSSYYLQEKETTKAHWDEVRTWAMDNGYTDLPTGGGKAANHPVHSVNWFDVVKWCNARSEKEGLTPVYTVSGAVMRTGMIEPVANWTANGYRLPTEAEWESACNGNKEKWFRFPCGTEYISHAEANFSNGFAYPSFATGTTGYHPSYNDGIMPYTSPVGSFKANQFGLYDMAGNVWELCWDWHDESYYNNGRTDPRGPSYSPSGGRIARGGDWNSSSSVCYVWYRGRIAPTGYGCGFRSARSIF